MKKGIHQISAVVLLTITLIPYAFTQQTIISDDPSYTEGESSALLDIHSENKGILIPRLTSIQRQDISTPATGLLIYQTDGSSGFYYFDGSNWIALPSEKISSLEDSDGDTKIQLEESPDEDQIRFDVAGSEAMIIDPNGNIGLGANPNYKFDVIGNVGILGDASIAEGLKFQTGFVSGQTSSRLFFCETADDLNGFSWIYAGSENPVFDGQLFELPDNTLYLRRHANSITGNTVLAIKRSNGYVGIRTDSPSSELDVNGTAIFNKLGIGTYPTNSALHLKGSDTYDGILRMQNLSNSYSTFLGITNSDWDVGPDKFIIGSGTPDHTNSSNIHFVMNAEGKIGVGTLDPAYQFEVLSDAAIQGSADDSEGIKLNVDYENGQTSSRLFFCETGDNKYGFAWAYAGKDNPTFHNYTHTLNSNALYLMRYENSNTGDPVMTFRRSNGRVGIGTINPYGIFHVHQDEEISTPEMEDIVNNYGPDYIGEDVLLWQSFTPTQSGYLTEIRLFTGDDTNCRLVMRIYKNEGISGDILGISQQIEGVDSYEWLPFVLENPVKMTAGSTYTFAVEVSNETWNLAIDQTNPYSEGYMHLESNPGITGDIMFKTIYVNNYQGEGNLLLNNEGDIGITGYMGVGTTTPVAPLDIRKVSGYASSDAIRIGVDGEYGAAIKFYDDDAEATQHFKMEYSAASQDLNFRSDDTNNILYLTENGRIGVGTSSPACPLDIVGSNYFNAGTYGFFNSWGDSGSSSNSANYSLRASHNILAAEFHANSDERIKTHIQSSDIQSDLKKISQLRLTTYQYIDTMSQGNRTKKGFIAQEVEQILPKAVHYSQRYIPDIFERATEIQKRGENIIITLKKAHNLERGKMLRLITPSGQKDVEVASIIDEKTFEVYLDVSTDEVFVYGKQVDDFRAIDYNYIFSTGIGAIQAIHKKNEQLHSQLNELENRVKNLEVYLNEMAAEE